VPVAQDKKSNKKFESENKVFILVYWGHKNHSLLSFLSNLDHLVNIFNVFILCTHQIDNPKKMKRTQTV